MLDWTRYKWLADYVVSRRSRTILHGYSVEDMRQDAYLRLWQACKTADGSRTTLSYLRTAIDRAVQRGCMRNGHVTTWTTSECCAQAARDSMFGDDTDDARAWRQAKVYSPIDPSNASADRTDDEDIDARDVTERALAVYHALPERDREILRRQFVEGATAVEIADELGISRERVRQLREAAVEKMRRGARLPPAALSAWVGTRRWAQVG